MILSNSDPNSMIIIISAGAGSAFQSVEGTERGLEQIVQENIDYVIDSSVNNPSTRKFSNIGKFIFWKPSHALTFLVNSFLLSTL